MLQGSPHLSVFPCPFLLRSCHVSVSYVWSLESQPFPDWNLVISANALQLCQMESGSNGGPPKVSVCMEIQENLEWSVYVWSKKLNVLEHPLFCSHPTEIRSDQY